MCVRRDVAPTMALLTYYREVSSVSLFDRLDWLLLDHCIKYFEGIQVYDILDVSCPEYLKGFIKLVDHGRNTRNSNNTNILNVPKTNLKLGEKIFQIQSISSLEWP